jgi:hypothetical protein
MKLRRALNVAIKWISLTLLIVFTAFEGWILYLGSFAHAFSVRGPEPIIFDVEVLLILAQAATILFSPWTRIPLIVLGVIEWLSMFLYALIAQRQTPPTAFGTSAFGAMFLLLAIVYAIAYQISSTIRE